MYWESFSMGDIFSPVHSSIGDVLNVDNINDPLAPFLLIVMPVTLHRGLNKSCQNYPKLPIVNVIQSDLWTNIVKALTTYLVVPRVQGMDSAESCLHKRINMLC